MRFLRLFWFQFKMYISNQYFFWLTITSTFSIFLLQYTIAYANHGLNDPMVWIRSAIYGLWASCTTAAGSIGYQRFQGTLPYIINTRYDERGSLIALLLPASSYGLLSFPLSFVLAKLFSVSTGKIDLKFIGMVLLLWIAAATMDILIAAFFTLTPNALVYEALINIPILLLTGLFGNKSFSLPLMNISQYFVPMTLPIKALIYADKTTNILAYICSLAIWIFLIIVIVKKINNLARKKGSLKII
ncbi:multidrug ABC transporter permease [uncultured Lactobacillus sp.]|uniref:multidrug ABC transporter permease n=1 Tax=uncultured Lactobacillus sp. TaxID=153152 RepID=UPI00259AF8E2|nr:multidrug ABC transporter permease [uncultured Lactobacillus sp.]